MQKLTAFLMFIMIATVACAQEVKKVETDAKTPDVVRNDGVKIKLFFSNSIEDPDTMECDVHYPTERTVPKSDTIEADALRELFKGTTPEEEKKGFGSWDAKDTKGIFKSVNIKDKIAYVNFNKVIYDQLGNATTSCGSGYFNSIVETLKQFDTVDTVYFAIEGKPADFYEWIAVGECPEGLEDCDEENFL